MQDYHGFCYIHMLENVLNNRLEGDFIFLILQLFSPKKNVNVKSCRTNLAKWIPAWLDNWMKYSAKSTKIHCTWLIEPHCKHEQMEYEIGQVTHNAMLTIT